MLYFTKNIVIHLFKQRLNELFLFHQLYHRQLQKMASTDSPDANEKRLFRESQIFHLNVIGKSIEKIIKNTTNTQFQTEVCQTLNVKNGRHKKTIQTKTISMMKINYQGNQQSPSN